MAAAAPSPLASSEEKTNGAKLSRLLIDGGTTVLKNVFNRHHPPANLAADLNANYSTLDNLLRRRVLHVPQWNKLFPPGGTMPDSNTFDITLLFLLLTKICGLSPPPTGWHTKPPASDNSDEANLARVKHFRNVLYGHVTSTGVDTHSFSVLWQEISPVLVALGLQQSEIDRLKAERGGEEDYLKALRDWADSEEDIKTQLKDVCQAQKDIKQTLLETHETCQESKTKLEGVHQVVTEIRQSQLNSNRSDEILKKLAKVDTQSSIEYYSERYLEGTRASVFTRVTNWLDDRSSPNRVLVISGNAGMGKSVIAGEMCKRIQESKRLSGSHFCQHDKTRHRNPKVMLQSLASHMSCYLPEYRKALVEQLSRNLGLEMNDMEVGDLFELLFEEPLRKVRDPGVTSLIVIDALDESEYQGRNELLEVISNYFNKLPLWIRFLVTTRPEMNIWERLSCLSPLVLESNDKENLLDIRILMEHQLSHLLPPKNLEVILEKLVGMSEGVILCARFLIDFVKESVQTLTLEYLESAIPSGISSVYQSYFKRLETVLSKELKITKDQFFSFLSVIAAAKEPLPIEFVSKLLFPGILLSSAQRKTNKAVSCISSLLPVQDGCVHFFHKSVKDWLVDKSSYGNHSFSVNKDEGHRILAEFCMGEFDEVKRKGVSDSEPFGDTARYALQHGVKHMLEMADDERTKSCSLENLVNMYVLDVELVYAKLRVNSAIPSEDIVCVMEQNELKKLKSLETLLFLLRKHSSSLKNLPKCIFQTLLNEGGPELSSEASKLLETKYSDISYMEYLNKNDLHGACLSTFSCSSQVACFDVSHRLGLMVCECLDGMIHLWSLHTGNLIWKCPAVFVKNYGSSSMALRWWPSLQSPYFSCSNLSDYSAVSLSCFRSVVFHPTKDVILPGVLCYAYNFDGDLNPLFPESKCIFTACSISGNTIITDCPQDAKCLILWSLENGTEVSRVVTNEDILSFARSQDGRLLAISHSTGLVCLLDAINGFQMLAETFFSYVCGIIKFTPDCRSLFCWHFPPSTVLHHLFHVKVNVGNDGNFSLDASRDTVSYSPWEHESCSESGFALGDSLECVVGSASDGVRVINYSFVFMLNEDFGLRSNPRSHFVDMLSVDELSRSGENRDAGKIVDNLVFSPDGETLYIMDCESDGTRISAWDVSNGVNKAETKILSNISTRCCVVPVDVGILLITRNGSVELWNGNFSECLRRWDDIKGMDVTKLIPVSDKHVVCTGHRCDGVCVILDITNGEKEEIKAKRNRYGFWGSVLACSSKRQLITIDDDLLSSGYSVFWEKKWSRENTHPVFNLPAMFSPAEEFLVISGEVAGHQQGVNFPCFFDGPQGVYVLDAASGDTLRKLCVVERVYDCKFLSNEECVLHTFDVLNGFRLLLYNIKSGNLLSVIDIDPYNQVYCLASHPWKGFIAIGLKHSRHKFKVIQVKLRSQIKDERKSKRLVLN
ncbi:uncharacterized protein [Porites lutea]|uniref:uncharacterized protein n=1 Tax=Porites lutea TaxID=51062 RepID=UPI003CC61A5C